MAIIHFWDMDHTIINNDCDVSWKEFMIFKGLCGDEAREKADYFYEQYKNECLDINEFLKFQLEEFKGNSVEHMRKLCLEHCEKFVKDKVYSQAKEMISQQIESGLTVCLLTATNRFIAEPVADLLGIKHILATELELADGKFTGSHDGIYCCAEGKIDHLKGFLAKHGGRIEDTAYYGDSSNDIVILEQVGHQFAVNPGDKLKQAAERNGWEVLDFN